jgi:hypothetical protein
MTVRTALSAACAHFFGTKMTLNEAPAPKKLQEMGGG